MSKATKKAPAKAPDTAPVKAPAKAPVKDWTSPEKADVKINDAIDLVIARCKDILDTNDRAVIVAIDYLEQAKKLIIE